MDEQIVKVDKTEQLAQEILETDDINKVKDLTHLFNLNTSKKNVLRILKYNDLLDKINDEATRRLENRPGEFSNSDLLNYLQVIQNSIEKANKSLNQVDETPVIQVNQNNLSINVDNGELNRESREKVMNAISSILDGLKNSDIDNNELNLIDFIPDMEEMNEESDR